MCTLIGTELDNKLLRINLINIQRYMMYELESTQYQLIHCWRNANTGLSMNITSEQSDHLFASFTTYIEYHIRALLKTLHLIILFPTINLSNNNYHSININDDNDECIIHTDSSWILSSNKLLQTNITSLINTGFTMSLINELNQNDIMKVLGNKMNIENSLEENNLSEIDILKNEYFTLQTTLNDISSLICVTPWNVLAFPVEQRLSLQESTTVIHPFRSEQSNLQISGRKPTVSSIISSNVSTSFSPNQVYILPTIKELPIQRKFCVILKEYFKQRKIVTYSLIGAFIITCSIALLVLFIVIYPNMNK
ncbi:Nitric oxide-associated protein 1 [Schistosoma japonicum]|nr:Nitric oxide-associated protein 1 [Schistosoma japonicum]